MKLTEALAHNRATRNLILLLGGSNALLVLTVLILMIQVSGRETEVRMIPPIPTTETMEVARSSYSASYAENWGMFVASMIGNVNPENISETLALLSRIMSSDLEDELRENMKASVETMKIQGFRLNFRPEEVRYDADSRLTYVIGHMTETPVRGEPVTTRFTYEMRFSLSHGVPVMTHFKAYEGRPGSES